MERKLKNYLERNNVKYTLHKHTAVFTVEESRKIKKEIPGLSCKTLFLKDNNGIFYLIGLPGEKRLDSKRLRSLLGVKKIRFGTLEELKEKVNLVPGSVSVFGIINAKQGVVLILDLEVFNADIVGFHPNINTETLEIKHKDLERFYKSVKLDKKILDL